MEEFKVSSEMKDLNIAFSQEAFIEGFELCEGRVARRFPELDLSFLGEEEAGKKVGPSSIEANLSSTKPIAEVLEPAMEVPEPTESTPVSSATAPLEVVDLR
ncbi:hypothetical protein COCNU_scaffold000979G000030 [Cocos nucifera]|nr:hypothetical protein [Cocos nucifera]